MKITLLKDVLLARSQLDRYYEGHVPVNLWRGYKQNQGRDLLAPIEEPRRMSNGQIRAADITIETRNGTKWVVIDEALGGISLFNKSGAPPGHGWSYYCLPAGLELPERLVIVEGVLNKRYGATHYTIAPASDMPLNQFKQLLNLLAREVMRRTGT